MLRAGIIFNEVIEYRKLIVRILRTGSQSVVVHRKLFRNCLLEVSPQLETEYCEPGVENRKLFRSWKPDIVNRKLKTEFVNRKLQSVVVNRMLWKLYTGSQQLSIGSEFLIFIFVESELNLKCITLQAYRYLFYYLLSYQEH